MSPEPSYIPQLGHSGYGDRHFLQSVVEQVQDLHVFKIGLNIGRFGPGFTRVINYSFNC
jgi:hypothetical protein